MSKNFDSAMELAMRLDIEEVFKWKTRWMGIYQVRACLPRGPDGIQPWADWGLFWKVWLKMLRRGELLVSFAPQEDQYARYLWVQVMNRGGS